MTNKEVNEIIMEFMNYEIDKYGCLTVGDIVFLEPEEVFTSSLDVLVPVWEKLKKEYSTEMIMGIQIFDYNGDPWNCEFETQEPYDKLGNTGICIEHPSKSAFESAAYATAKAILELKK